MTKRRHSGEVVLYALSTCIWCRRTKDLLDSMGVGYTLFDMDLLEPQEKAERSVDLKRYNPRGGYPTLVVGDSVVIGFDENRIREILG
jgi:glutaredoxin